MAKTRDDFSNACVAYFNAKYRGIWTIDELLLHPRAAAKLVEEFRLLNPEYAHKLDDEILRVILARRKSPKTGGGYVNVWHYKGKK